MRNLSKLLVFSKHDSLLKLRTQHKHYLHLQAPRLNKNNFERNNKMTPEDKFLFDLNGFIVVRNAINETEVSKMNAAIDEHIDKARPRYVDDKTQFCVLSMLFHWFPKNIFYNYI